MGIFDKLFGKKTLEIKLTNHQKTWLNLVDMRVNASNFNFIKRSYTVESYGQAHFHEYKVNEDRVPWDEREEVAQSRVAGLLSVEDYIKNNGSEEQKFHHASSLIGAILYANSLETPESQHVLISDFDEIKKIMNLHTDRKLVADEVDAYETKIGRQSTKLQGLTEDELNDFHIGAIGDIVKIDILIRQEKNLKEQENLFLKALDIAPFSPVLVMDKLNDYAYNQFEQEKHKEGLNLSAQAIFLCELEVFDDSDAQREKLACLSDTFSNGLYLSGQYKDAIRMSDILISLSPDNSNISEHYTNRGKSKLMLKDITGAKLDFEEALENDESFEEAIELLENLNK